jgi:hypothetical protein
MLLPTNLRAGWLFRFLENADLRSQQLDAVRGELLLKGVVLPVVLTSPLLALHFGAQIAVALTPLTLLIGWTLAEALSIDWRRIPFTCTVLFAKRPPAYTVGLVVLIFGWFVFAAASALAVARAGALPWALVAIGVASVAITLRQFRMAQWGRWPLEFEDYLPDGVDSLRLRE